MSFYAIGAVPPHSTCLSDLTHLIVQLSKELIEIVLLV